MYEDNQPRGLKGRIRVPEINPSATVPLFLKFGQGSLLFVTFCEKMCCLLRRFFRLRRADETVMEISRIHGVGFVLSASTEK